MNPIHVPQVFALLIVTLHQAVAFEKPADCEQMMIEKGINALKVHKGTNTDEKAYGDLVLNSKLGRRFWEYGIQQHCKFSGAEFPHTSNCPENSGEDRIFICLREQMERETFDKGPAQEHIQYFFALANQALKGVDLNRASISSRINFYLSYIDILLFGREMMSSRARSVKFATNEEEKAVAVKIDAIESKWAEEFEAKTTLLAKKSLAKVTKLKKYFSDTQTQKFKEIKSRLEDARRLGRVRERG